MSSFIKRALIALSLCLFVTTIQAEVAPGDTPPDSLGQTRKGEDIHITHMHGKVVVVVFWASWCQYCQKEFPILANIQKLVSPTQLQVVAVDQDEREVFIKLNRALAKMTPDVIYTYDPGSVGKAYGAKTIPRVMLIDRDGKVAYVHIGYDDDVVNDLANEVTALLAKPAGQIATPSS